MIKKLKLTQSCQALLTVSVKRVILFFVKITLITIVPSQKAFTLPKEKSKYQTN